VLLLSANVPARNAGPPPEPPVMPPTIDDPQRMKAATMAIALTRSARLHRFQSDFKSRIGYLSTSGEFVPELALLKLTSRALLEYPPDGGTLLLCRGAVGVERPAKRNHSSPR
jgi:hypothetical protein